MMRISAILALCLAVATQLTAAPDVLAAEDIGGAKKIIRTVTGRLSGAATRLNKGDRVFRNQHLRAGRASLGQFQFRDDTRLALNANSSVKLDKFVYAGSGINTQLLMKAARGAFRFATGNMPSRAYKIITPSSTIGVRGTWFDVFVGRRGQTIVTVLYGEIEACSNGGQCRTLSNQCESVRIEPNGQIVDAARPDATILADETPQRAIPFLISQSKLLRSMRIPNRAASRCSGLAEAEPENNIDGASGDPDGGGDSDGGGGGGGFGSDIRLKRDVHVVGKTPGGLPLYRFKYTWSEKEWVGVMAQDVLKVMPKAISTDSEGYYLVNYQMLDLEMIPYDQWFESYKKQKTGLNLH